MRSPKRQRRRRGWATRRRGTWRARGTSRRTACDGWRRAGGDARTRTRPGRRASPSVTRRTCCPRSTSAPAARLCVPYQHSAGIRWRPGRAVPVVLDTFGAGSGRVRGGGRAGGRVRPRDGQRRQVPKPLPAAPRRGFTPRVGGEAPLCVGAQPPTGPGPCEIA